MEIDFDTFLKLASFLLSISAVVYSFFVNRKKDTDERFAAGTKRMTKIEQRVADVEHDISTMPAKDDMHRLEIAMTEMAGEMKAVGAHISSQRDVMRRIESVVTRHEDHLLDGGKK